MSYRDDIDALFHRAQSLQHEVDTLREQLEQERQGRATGARAERATIQPIGWGTARAEPAPSPLPDPDEVLRKVHQASAERRVWLPFERTSSDEVDRLHERAVRAPHDRLEDVGVLVARLTEIEHALVVRLLELLTDSDFSPAAIDTRRGAFDDLVAELRRRLAIAD